MDFVELNRHFLPITKDEEIDAEYAHMWGQYLGDTWLSWKDLVEKRRVVLLAEALSGKTEEFTNRASKLRAEGKAAFLARVEELADDGFEGSLAPADLQLFKKWKQGYKTGYFFLDSVDEARLNRKNFDSALKKLARVLDGALGRSRIYVSCRASDWRGANDRRTLNERLPIPTAKPKPTVVDPDTALLEPMFSNRNVQEEDEGQVGETEPDLFVVRLAPLSEEQQKVLADKLGVEDPSAFLHSIWKNGLEGFAERPGDLIDLAEYWQRYRDFTSLKEMTAYGVERKLSELDPNRGDNTQLTLQKARDGAAHIAAGLTLGQSFTLRAPAQEPDPELAAGALDANKLLADWTDGERATLLRRGIFTPATYGRIRFHQRSTQEFLTAQWFHSQLEQGCPKEVVFQILFNDIYSVKTIVPSVRPAAAWLALWHDDVRGEILNRDPLMLIQYGDPGSLPLETRRELLHAYARMDKAGDIADDTLDHRSLWMFAHSDLADTIRKVWSENDRRDFRNDMLRLIREGRIDACADLAADMAQDKNADRYIRTVAVQALAACGRKSELTEIASRLLEDASTTNASFACSLARVLFPEHISVGQLLTLIRDTNPPAAGSAQGFGYYLEELFSKCPAESRWKFISGIVKLALSEPFVDSYQRLSSRYRFLARHVEPIARQIIGEVADQDPPAELVGLLMSIERADRSSTLRRQEPPLHELVQSHPKLQRALLWADVEEARKHNEDKREIDDFQQIHFLRSTLWALSNSDLSWLYEDLDKRALTEDKKIALSAIIWILRSSDSTDQYVQDLRARLNDNAELIHYLNGYFQPNVVSDLERQRRARQEAREKVRAEQEERDKTSWREFRDDLVGDPSIIMHSHQRLRCITNLTRWLMRRTNQDATQAARQGPLLEEAFGAGVADAYREAMKMLWRETTPKRPRRQKGGPITTKWVTIYSFAAIGIEADADAHWANILTEEEAKRAAEHGCISEQGYPDWLDTLLEAHPNVVLPIIEKELRREWKSESDGGSDLLYRYRSSPSALHPDLEARFFEIIMRSAPSSVNHLDSGLRFLERLDLSESQRKRVIRVGSRKLVQHVKQQERDFALRYLALLFQVDPSEGMRRLERWIEDTDHKERAQFAIFAFGVLFDREGRGLNVGSLDNASTVTLGDLILLAYRFIRSDQDIVHEGVYEPGMRDRAESARGAILAVLVNRAGSDAYEQMITLAEAPEIGERSIRFRQLARRMAQRDAERPAWTETDVVAFGTLYRTPIKSGNDLHRTVLDVLTNIRYQLDHADASSKRLLARQAHLQQEDEDSLQNWLAEQLSLRANGRYHVHRESQVEGKNKPDIIVSGASGVFEIALEVKPADSYSPNELKHALDWQLAETYLKSTTRRHGVLVLFDFGRRKWRNPDTGKALTFDDLLDLLSQHATKVKRNSTGDVLVSIFGLSAVDS